MRYRVVKTCKVEGCDVGISARSKLGYCRRHRWLARPKRPFDRDRFQSWLDADPENPKRNRATIRAWAKRNPEKVKKADREYQKRKRNKAALAELNALRPQLRENILRAREAARLRGFTGRINVERR